MPWQRPTRAVIGALVILLVAFAATQTSLAAEVVAQRHAAQHESNLHEELPPCLDGCLPWPAHRGGGSGATLAHHEPNGPHAHRRGHEQHRAHGSRGQRLAGLAPEVDVGGGSGVSGEKPDDCDGLDSGPGANSGGAGGANSTLSGRGGLSGGATSSSGGGHQRCAWAH